MESDDKDDIDCLFNWAPTEKQWWITGFNPEFDEPKCNDMVVIGSIDFWGKEEMYEGLYDAINTTKMNYLKENILFDEDGHTVWIIWDKKKEKWFEKISNLIISSNNADGL